MKTVPFSTCETGKRGFESRHDAEKALGRARTSRERFHDKHSASRRGMRVEARVYECSECDLWHLTAQSRREYNSYAGEAA